jgi:hypothetical protein
MWPIRLSSSAQMQMGSAAQRGTHYQLFKALAFWVLSYPTDQIHILNMISCLGRG